MTTEPIWKTPFTVELANRVGMNTANAHMGIEMLEAGPDYVVGRMPVDHRTKQPAGILHGGASVLLAETLASWAGAFVVDATQQTVVGQEINANDIVNLKFLPATNWSGNTSFGWNASDGEFYAAASSQVKVTITAVNDPPTLDLNGGEESTID